MVKIYYDKDADRKVLKGKKIAVMGYGSQGHAHANNLKESGMDVIIGIRKGAGWDKAENAGFKVYLPAEAAGKADVIMMLLPDEYMAGLFCNGVSSTSRPQTFVHYFVFWQYGDDRHPGRDRQLEDHPCGRARPRDGGEDPGRPPRGHRARHPLRTLRALPRALH